MNQTGWCLPPSRLGGQSTLLQSFGEIISLIHTEPIWEDVFWPVLFSSLGPIWPAESWGIFCSLSGLSQYSNQGLWLVRRVKPWLCGLTSLHCSSSSTSLCWGRTPEIQSFIFYFILHVFFYRALFGQQRQNLSLASLGFASSLSGVSALKDVPKCSAVINLILILKERWQSIGFWVWVFLNEWKGILFFFNQWKKFFIS